VVQLGEVAAVRVFQWWFWPFLHSFSSSFRSQIYTTPLLFSRHAPLSLVPSRRLLLPPVARFTPAVRVRQVVCMRQRAICYLAHVTATLRLFLASCLVFVFFVCLYCIFSCLFCTVCLYIAKILLKFLLA